MALHVDRRGTGPRIVLVHGFTQTGRCWGPVDEDLGADHEVVLVDAPGHGGSAEIRADLTTGAALIAAAGGRATYIGYSMGARYALHVALHHPEVVAGLVVIGGTAGIDDPEGRSARRASDDALAQRIRAIGVPQFIDEWLALPLFAGLSSVAAHRDARSENTAEGLATSLELAGAGTQEPAWDELHRIVAPVLVVAGGDDSKFAALAARLAAGVGDSAELALVPGAGHTAHLEQPARFVALLRPWLARHGL